MLDNPPPTPVLKRSAAIKDCIISIVVVVAVSIMLCMQFSPFRRSFYDHDNAHSLYDSYVHARIQMLVIVVSFPYLKIYS